MSVNINTFTFEFWHGPPPGFPTRKVAVTHRPGVNGVAHQILGVWGDTFDVVLTSHHESLEMAVDRLRAIRGLIGMGPMYIDWGDTNWSGSWGVMYNVEAIEQVSLKVMPRLIGPNYDYVGGAELKTRFTLTPQEV